MGFIHYRFVMHGVRFLATVDTINQQLARIELVAPDLLSESVDFLPFFEHAYTATGEKLDIYILAHALDEMRMRDLSLLSD